MNSKSDASRNRSIMHKAFILIGLVVIVVQIGYLIVQRLYRHAPTCNVIVMILDTVRADRLGCYGCERGITPEIDRFAEDAIVFDNTVAQSPWTLPSVASLYTSRYPFQHGAGGRIGEFTVLGDYALTVGEVFQRAGAKTGVIANVMFFKDSFGMAQGFDVIDVTASHNNREMRRAGPTTDTALAWLESHGQKPFFLIVHYFDPHLIYDPPSPFRERFADPRDKGTRDPLFGTRQDLLDFRSGKKSLEKDLLTRLASLYDGEVAYVDSEVGRLLRAIDDLGFASNTTVVITSDHGEEFHDHGGFEHGHTLYDELLRVPLIIRLPQRPNSDSPQLKTGHVSATVRHIDLAPTLCKIAGIDAPESFQGTPLVSFPDDPPISSRPVLSEWNMWGPSGVAWRKGRFKLIVFNNSTPMQLFDLEQDPFERDNIADRSPEIAAQMVSDVELVVQTLSGGGRARETPRLEAEEMERLRSLGYMK